MIRADHIKSPPQSLPSENQASIIFDRLMVNLHHETAIDLKDQLTSLECKVDSDTWSYFVLGTLRDHVQSRFSGRNHMDMPLITEAEPHFKRIFGGAAAPRQMDVSDAFVDADCFSRSVQSLQNGWLETNVTLINPSNGLAQHIANLKSISMEGAIDYVEGRLVFCYVRSITINFNPGKIQYVNNCL